MSLSCLVLAVGPAAGHVVTGLTLAERGRRVARRAGVAGDRIHVVADAAGLARARAAADGPLLLLDASTHVVAAELVEPLRPGEPGVRVAFRDGVFAGALRADADGAGEVWDALAADPAGGAAAAAARLVERGAWRVDVGPRARHPARTREELHAADAWQFELVNKKLDSFLCTAFYRPLARPLTRLFLRTPITPNLITVVSAALSIAGCWIAAGATWREHAIGMAVLLAGGIIDCNDGEVARLRLEGSVLGGWLDAIGDDLSRAALILGVGAHLEARHPDLPIAAITGATLAATLLAMGLIYWYCIFVIRSSNNQDYTNVLGIGPGQGAGGTGAGRRSLGRLVADWGAQAARRDFIDLAAFVLALAGLPEVTGIGLAAGAAISLLVVIPTHVKIVRSRS